MKPRHAAELLMAKETNTNNTKIKKLIDDIISSQQKAVKNIYSINRYKFFTNY